MQESYVIEKLVDGKIVKEEVPLRNALNEVLRTDYLDDNQKGVDYWNRILTKANIDFEFCLPHRRFNRAIGIYASNRFDTQGNPLTEAEFVANQDKWLPKDEDRQYVTSLMVSVTEPGKYAGWIAPPSKDLNGQAADFDYVRL
jgi:benzoyl-CoA 2,3-dioxygenase component B